jgi:WD40 repeat protein
MTCIAVVRDAEGNLRVWDEESGQLHRELEDFKVCCAVTGLVTFLSPNGQQPRLVAGSSAGELRVYNPEAGSVLHYLRGRDFGAGYHGSITGLACIASSSAPHTTPASFRPPISTCLPLRARSRCGTGRPGRCWRACGNARAR